MKIVYFIVLIFITNLAVADTVKLKTGENESSSMREEESEEQKIDLTYGDVAHAVYTKNGELVDEWIAVKDTTNYFLLRRYSMDGTYIELETHIKGNLEDIEKSYQSNSALRIPPKNTQFDGLYTLYNEDGTVKSQFHYEENKLLDDKGLPKNGYQREYHSNGKLSSEYFYKNGLIEGEGKYFYEDGTIAEVAPYKNGKLEGELISFYPNGQIFIKWIYQDGELLEKYSYDEEGKQFIFQNQHK